MTRLTNPQILAAGLAHWRTLNASIVARYATGDFATGAALVAAIAEAAESADHHPDVVLTYPAVVVTLTSHDEGGVTQRDIDLARVITRLADERRVEAQPETVHVVDLALDTADQSEIDRFWSVVLTGSPDNVHDDDVVDPLGRSPLLWFQHTSPHDVPRQRFHLDIAVPPEAIEARTEAALEAGGKVGADTPTFRVLVDRQGNKACLCWAEGRNS